MRIIKSSKADLESKRFIFKEIGIIIALGLVFWAFELKSLDKKEIDQISRAIDDTPEEMVEITQQTKPPPPPSPPQQTTLIKIVENDIEVETEIEINVEANQDTEVEKYIPIDIVEEEEIEKEETIIFTIVESMPQFPEGETVLLTYLSDHINYSELARESGIQGRVFITFVVEKDGQISNVRMLRGIGGGCDEEAIRVIKSMPQWIPGKQRNIPVRVQFNLPIKFILH